MPPSPFSHAGCYRSGLKYTMKTKLHAIEGTASATDCQMKCILHKLCKVFNFHPDQGVCVLVAEYKSRSVLIQNMLFPGRFFQYRSDPNIQEMAAWGVGAVELQSVLQPLSHLTELNYCSLCLGQLPYPLPSPFIYRAPMTMERRPKELIRCCQPFIFYIFSHSCTRTAVDRLVS